MSADKCRPVVVDGEVIRVLGGAEMTDVERGYFADIVRAAKRRFESEQAEADAVPEPRTGAV